MYFSAPITVDNLDKHSCMPSCTKFSIIGVYRKLLEISGKNSCKFQVIHKLCKRTRMRVGNIVKSRQIARGSGRMLAVFGAGDCARRGLIL